MSALAIVDYATLQNAVGQWLNRSDLTDQIPAFIQLCEAQLKRKLRRTTTRATITIADESTILPGDAAELRSVRLVSDQPFLDTSLKTGTVEWINDRRAELNAVAGRPKYATLVGGQLLVVPAPDQAYQAEVFYFQQLSPLSDTNTTNSVLTEAPDLYLFGALKEAEPFLEHDERIQVWETKYADALTQLLDVRDREEFNASLQPIRLPVVFG